MSDIAIAVLDLNRESVDFPYFQSLPAEEKISLIANRITNLCEELKTREPNSMWLITWREYGITDGFEKSLTPEQKKLFKETMQQLVEKFQPNLTIAAGTIATKKKVKKKDKLKKFTEYYEKHHWIKEKEAKWEDDQQQIAKEEKKIDIIQNKEDQEDYFAVRNTCYVFTREFDEEDNQYFPKIWRHDKIAPYNETKTATDADKIEIFQPGKGGNLSPYCILIHPVTKELIIIGVEICREHDFQNLKRNKDNQDIFLQLVMSDSIALRLNNLCGKYIMPLDSKYKARLYTKQKELDDLPVRWYQTDMLSNIPYLSGPLDASYPFEMRVFDLLYDEIQRLPHGSKNHGVMWEILEEFLNAVYKNKGEKLEVVYDVLEKALNTHVKDLQNTTSATTVFSQPAHITTLITSLYKLLAEERKKQLVACEFLGKSDAYLQDKKQVFINAIDIFDQFTALECIRNYNVLNELQLDISQINSLLRIVYCQLPSEESQQFYFEKIFSNGSSLLNVSCDLLGGKSLLHIMIESNMHEALRSALVAYKKSVADFPQECNSLLKFALQAGANEKLIAILKGDEAEKVELHMKGVRI